MRTKPRNSTLKPILIMLFIIVSNIAYNQNYFYVEVRFKYDAEDTLHHIFINNLAELNFDNSPWSIYWREDSVILAYINEVSFTLRPSTKKTRKKLLRKASVDTLYLYFRFQEGWTYEKIDSIKQSNHEIMAPLIDSCIAYYEKTKYPFKTNSSTMKNAPYSFLQSPERWRPKPKYVQEHLSQLEQVHQLPDLILKNYGVFLSSSFLYRLYHEHIIQEEVMEDINSMLFSVLELNRYNALFTNFEKDY